MVPHGWSNGRVDVGRRLCVFARRALSSTSSARRSRGARRAVRSASRRTRPRARGVDDARIGVGACRRRTRARARRLSRRQRRASRRRSQPIRRRSRRSTASGAFAAATARCVCSTGSTTTRGGGSQRRSSATPTSPRCTAAIGPRADLVTFHGTHGAQSAHRVQRSVAPRRAVARRRAVRRSAARVGAARRTRARPSRRRQPRARRCAARHAVQPIVRRRDPRPRGRERVGLSHRPHAHAPATRRGARPARRASRSDTSPTFPRNRATSSVRCSTCSVRSRTAAACHASLTFPWATSPISGPFHSAHRADADARLRDATSHSLIER